MKKVFFLVVVSAVFFFVSCNNQNSSTTALSGPKAKKTYTEQPVSQPTPVEEVIQVAEGFTITSKGSKSTVEDSNGNVILSGCENVYVDPWDNIVCFKKNGKDGVYNPTTKRITVEPLFDDINLKHALRINGKVFSRVKIGEKAGVVEITEGKVIIPVEYCYAHDRIFSTSEKNAIFIGTRKDKGEDVYNMKGECIFSTMVGTEQWREISENNFLFKEGEKDRVINTQTGASKELPESAFYYVDNGLIVGEEMLLTPSGQVFFSSKSKFTLAWVWKNKFERTGEFVTLVWQENGRYDMRLYKKPMEFKTIPAFGMYKTDQDRYVLCLAPGEKEENFKGGAPYNGYR